MASAVTRSCFDRYSGELRELDHRDPSSPMWKYSLAHQSVAPLARNQKFEFTSTGESGER
jgi:hypothetical protein